PFFSPPAAPPPALHSFPTRRSSDLAHVDAVAVLVGRYAFELELGRQVGQGGDEVDRVRERGVEAHAHLEAVEIDRHFAEGRHVQDRKSTRLNSSHVKISYAVFCLKK